MWGSDIQIWATIVEVILKCQGFNEVSLVTEDRVHY